MSSKFSGTANKPLMFWPLQWELLGELILFKLEEKSGLLRAVVEKIENYLGLSKPLGSTLILFSFPLCPASTELSNSIV